jgi:hypothetical protein
MKYLYFYICFLIFIICIFAYFNVKQSVEAFTPKIRSLYRPYIRKARIMSKNMYDKTSSNVSNIFRKTGLI